MTSVILSRASIHALGLLRDGETSSGQSPVAAAAKTIPLSSDPRTARAVSPAIADVLLSFSDTGSGLNKIGLTSDSNLTSQTTRSQNHHLLLDGVSSHDLLRLWFLFNAIKAGNVTNMKDVISRVPSYLAQKLQNYSIEDLSGDIDIRLDDQSIVDCAKNNVLGILHYHYEDRKAQDWMEQHFGRSGEMNCDPNDPCVRAVLNGTAKIFRGTDIPEVGLWSSKEKVYGTDPVTNKQEVVGTRTSRGISKDFVSEFEKDNPGYGVRPVIIAQDVALIVYAKS